MFIPRHPVVENQFCQLAGQTSTTGGAGDVLAYAGSVCYLDDSQTESTVKIYTNAEDKPAFGFLMQKVKTGYHSIHAPGFMMPGDLGSSDVIAQPSYNNNGVINGTKPAPVGVAHLGIWETIHYYSTAAINAGSVMGVYQNASTMSQISNVSTNSGAGDVAVVVKGASAAQVTANVNNTTLYPIRVKLLV
ncbi:MAG: hypothetical protein DRO67_04130 [Candidatus Asgardarchaeum californiense]|nr:MAG: hypothetical protein DRO67_04130 [Candidatus Asgardarchaeum californiense]